MNQVLFKNARVFDGHSADCLEGTDVLVEGDRIREVSQKPISAANARIVDVGGRTLMPGMIDAHVHAFFSNVAVQKVESLGETYRAVHAVRMLSHALQCGFTTVRDVGGGNYSLYRALEDKMFAGPRYLYSGKTLSMTGGHGDLRQLEERPRYEASCACSTAPLFNFLGVVADGVDECVKAAREQLRQGAHCIKIMGSGGVSSPTDPIWMNQFREDEIRAIVSECTERRSYVAAHCHPASAVRRSVEFGVRSIEHATLIDADTAAFVAERGAFVVPTMIIIEQLFTAGRSMGFPSQSQDKVEFAWQHALSGLDLMRQAGVKICFGTDLLGDLYARQCREFILRSEVFTPLEILRQATSITAEMMMMEGQIGCIAPDAFADILVVEGDPLSDISLMAGDGSSLAAIMRGGEIVKCRL